MAHEGAAPGGAFPPATFDDFEVVRPLGRGGMGAVYLGHDTMLDRAVALKFIAASEPGTRHRDRFLTEARAIARLQHPNVVGVYRIGEVGGRPYLAYEFVDGADLHRMPKPIRWPTALAIGIGVARGLSAAHRRGVLHRDVKPANIMVTASGDVKLLDFGLAKLTDADEAGAPAVNLAAVGDVTSVGTMAGTPLYMAPELWQGEPASAPSDVYAFGLVLYELIAGALPHAGLGGQDLIDAIQRRDLPPVRDRLPDVPSALCDVITRCTRRHGRDRFASADEARDALEAVQAYYQPFGDSATTRGGGGGDDADRVGQSFGRVVQSASDEFPRRFYMHLFERAPAARAMFPADMTAQHLKLLGSLKLIVRQLHAPAELVPFLEQLGRRHAGYGVEAPHFEHFAGALVDTLRELDAAAWSVSLEDAWRFACGRIAQTMVRAIDQERRNDAETIGSRAPALFEVPVATPPTRQARASEAAVPYRVLGDGPIDLALIPPGDLPIDAAWDEPRTAAFMRLLASFVRVVLVGPGGASIEERMRQVSAVLDAVSSERAFVVGAGAGAAAAACFTATYTERARGLVLLGDGGPLVASLLPLVHVPTLRIDRAGAESWPLGAGDASAAARDIEQFVHDPALAASGQTRALRLLATALAVHHDGAGDARAAFAREAQRRAGALVDRAPEGVSVAVFDGPSPARACAQALLASHGALAAVVHAGECRIAGGDLEGAAIDEAIAMALRAPAGAVELGRLARLLGERD